MIDSSNVYGLSEFAEKINVSTKTLQRWDASGLLVAERTKTNRRRYTDDHLRRYREMKELHSERLTRRKNFKYKDLTGLVFGKLTVSHRVDDFIGGNGHRHIQWLCHCECGETRVCKGASLSAGYNKSCGCSQYGDGDTKRMWSEYLSIKEDEASTHIKEKKAIGRERQDLTGQTFGWLTALEHGPDVKHGNSSKATTWQCKCKCGNIVDVVTSRLKGGDISSCGCMPKDLRQSFKGSRKKGYNSLIDIAGQQFGFWTVLERAESKRYPSGGQVVMWSCRCLCGAEKIVPGRDLRSGSSQSCGCMTSTSWLEYHVGNYLDEVGVHYESQVQYPDLLGVGGKPLSYDFLVYDADKRPIMFIECQGEQHYRPIRRFGGAKKLVEQQMHDRLKKNYAADMFGIAVNEVLYTCKTERDIRAIVQSFGL